MLKFNLYTDTHQRDYWKSKHYLIKSKSPWEFSVDSSQRIHKVSQFSCHLVQHPAKQYIRHQNHQDGTDFKELQPTLA